MSNPTAKPSTSLPVTVSPVSTDKVVNNFALATSQLIELLGDCRENCKKNTDITRQLNGVQDRVTALEQKVNLPHPPQPPHHLTATTEDLGKAMVSIKSDYMKEMMEIKKQLSSIQDEMKTLREDREATLKEMFALSNNTDTMRTTLQSAVSTLVKGAIELLRKLDTQVGGMQAIVTDKK